MKKDYQERKKFFFAVPSIFPKWNYPSRLAIGVKLDDAWYKNAPYFKFKIKDKFYKISREKGIELGKKYKLSGGSLPNLIPLEEFKVVTNEPKQEELFT